MNSFDWTQFSFWLITISTLHVTVIAIVVLCLVRLTQRKQPAVAHSFICGGMLCFLLIPVAVLSLHDRSWQTLGGGDAQSMEITAQIENENLNKNASTAQLHSPPPTESIDPISPARPDREVLDAVANAPSTNNEHQKRRQAVVAKLNMIPFLQGLAASPPALLFSLVLSAFFVGSMLFSVKLALALVWASQITARAAPAPSQVLAISEEYALQFGIRDQQVLVSGEIQRPMLWGIGHATIVLPEHCRSWSDTELHLVFAHEFAHISRRDHLSKIAFQCVLILYWFHPLVRWLDRKAESMAEQSADDLCIANGVAGFDLSECLMRFVTSDSIKPVGLQFASYRDLRARVERLTSGRYSKWKISKFGRVIQVSFAIAASLSLSILVGLGGRRTTNAIQHPIADTLPNEMTPVQQAIAKLKHKPAWSHLPLDLETQVLQQYLTGHEFNVQVTLVDEEENPIVGTLCAIIENTKERLNSLGHNTYSLERLPIAIRVTDASGACMFKKVHGRPMIGRANGIVQALLVVLHPEYGFRIFPLKRSNRLKVLAPKMESGKTLSGLITSEDNAPIAELPLRISLRKSQDEDGMPTLFDGGSILAPELATRSDGSFSIEGIPPDHFINVYPIGDDGMSIQNGKGGRYSIDFASAENGHVDLAMHRDNKPEIRFKCVNRDGLEVPPLPQCGTQSMSIPQVDSNGYCVTRSYYGPIAVNKEFAQLTLHLHMPSPWVSLVSIRSMQDSTEPFEVPVVRGRIIRGRVIHETTGQPLGGLDVYGFEKKPGTQARIFDWTKEPFDYSTAESRTNENGEFELTASVESWTLHINGPVYGYDMVEPWTKDHYDSTTVPAGSESLAGIVFKMRPQSKLRGVVLTEAGLPVAQTVVSCSYMGTELNETVTWTNAQGEFEVLPPSGTPERFELKASTDNEHGRLILLQSQLRTLSSKPIELRLK